MNRGPLSLIGFAIGAILLYFALYAGAMEVRLNAGSDSYATLLLGELWFGLAPGTLNFLQAHHLGVELDRAFEILRHHADVDDPLGELGGFSA